MIRAVGAHAGNGTLSCGLLCTLSWQRRRFCMHHSITALLEDAASCARCELVGSSIKCCCGLQDTG